KAPGPYVLAGHSDGGLFVQLYASRHSADVRGLVLIDAVHSDYYARRIALLNTLLPPAQRSMIRTRASRAGGRPRDALSSAATSACFTCRGSSESNRRSAASAAPARSCATRDGRSSKAGGASSAYWSPTRSRSS